MPNLDKTGPMGDGPGTGRGLGPCGTDNAGGSGRGFGQGRGRGGGRPCVRIASVSQDQERDALIDEVSALEEILTAAKERLQELERKD